MCQRSEKVAILKLKMETKVLNILSCKKCSALFLFEHDNLDGSQGSRAKLFLSKHICQVSAVAVVCTCMSVHFYLGIWQRLLSKEIYK